jgi:hypothetical protein
MSEHPESDSPHERRPGGHGPAEVFESAQYASTQDTSGPTSHVLLEDGNRRLGRWVPVVLCALVCLAVALVVIAAGHPTGEDVPSTPATPTTAPGAHRGSTRAEHTKTTAVQRALERGRVRQPHPGHRRLAVATPSPASVAVASTPSVPVPPVPAQGSSSEEGQIGGGPFSP